MKNSRRTFLLGAAAVAASAQSRNGALTTKDVIDRIQKNVGVPWREQTVDTIKSGAPSTVVKGIATTMMATFDVVERAAAAGRNMVITHEPTFYSHEDKTDVLKDDPIYQAKQAFLDQHEMVVFRFHDHWHARHPDGIATGMAQALGWEKQADPQNPRQFVFDGITLATLARQIQDKLKIRTMRVVGDPELRVRTVAANWGYASALRPFARPDLDVLIIGEAREWELRGRALHCAVGKLKTARGGLDGARNGQLLPRAIGSNTHVASAADSHPFRRTATARCCPPCERSRIRSVISNSAFERQHCRPFIEAHVAQISVGARPWI